MRLCAALILLCLHNCVARSGAVPDSPQLKHSDDKTHRSILETQSRLTSGGRKLQRLYTAHVRKDGSRFQHAPEYADFPQYLPISALYDRPEQKVIINALVTDDLAGALMQCVFSESWSMENPVVLEAHAVERYSWKHEGDWTEHKIVCLTAGSNLTSLKDPLVDVQLVDGALGGHPVRLEILSTVETEGVALCGPTLTNANTWMKDYVKHYKQLGVDEFHFYLPEGDLVDKVFDGNTSEKDKQMPIASKRFEPFEHPNVRWHNFTASPEHRDFNLRAANNDCISRIRYSHQYAIVAEADKFLHMTLMSQATTVKDLLDRFLPETTAGLGLVDLYFPRDCPIKSMWVDKDGMPRSWKGHLPDSYCLHNSVRLTQDGASDYWGRHPRKAGTLPIKENPFNLPFTTMVRVKSVYSVNIHGPELLMSGVREVLNFLPHFVATFKHIDYQGPSPCMFGGRIASNYLFHPDAILHLVDN